MTALVVETNPRERAFICRIVGKEYPALIALNFNDASHLVQTLSPDLVVAGITKADTPEAVKWIHSLSSLPNTEGTLTLLLLAREESTKKALTKATAALKNSNKKTIILACEPHDETRICEALNQIAPHKTQTQNRRSAARTEAEPPRWKNHCYYPDIAAARAIAHAHL